MSQFSGSAFFLVQLGMGIILLVIAFFFINREPKSDFKMREADRTKTNKPAPPRNPAEDPLANARLKSRERLSLPGIRIDGAAHEVLGVSALATKAEIQTAYRNLMKIYHPDRVGRPGSREWQDAQKIAEALNQAKDELLARYR